MLSSINRIMNESSLVNISKLHQSQQILLKCISGSKAYGLDTPASDTDIRGVFIHFPARFYSLTYEEQINDDRHDVSYYELKRFVELLSKNNPNILELLYTPPECVLYQHPVLEPLGKIHFLSKLCKNTFAGYAMTQVKKARGLNKKILNPLPPERKNILDFCYITHGQGSKSLLTWLAEQNYQQEQCGLVNIPHMKNMYALFYDTDGSLGYKGIMQKAEANEVALSSVPKKEKIQAYLCFNREGYSSYCKEYRDYWDWVEKRNENRYKSTLSHGKNYDAKNMMHTFRLLDMAREIAEEGTMHVKRPNRDFLLNIRKGEFEYEDLLQMAEEKIEQLEQLYQKSDLPEAPDLEQINEALVRIRQDFYQGLKVG